MKTKLFPASATATALALTLVLGGCAGSNPPAGVPDESKTPAPGQAAADPGEAGYDLAGIKADPEVEALVPQKVKTAGVLINGASTDYPPAQYKKADGQTPTGYGVDMVGALAKLMGLKAETSHVDFDALLPQVGSKFDIGESSFTITAEREAQYDMIAYAKVGFAFAVPTGNPGKFDPNDPCGKVVGVQTGTAQLEAMQEISKKCEADGKKAIDLKPHKLQSEVTDKVASGQYDATVADAPVIGYLVKMTNGRLEKIGDQFDVALHGIVVPKNNPELSKAIMAGLQKLMDSGELKKIFELYGAGEIALEKPELNPKAD